MERQSLKKSDIEQLEASILFNDEDLIILNKPSTLPVVPDKTGDRSLLEFAEAYCGHPLKVVHRIDRPCSGLTIFAKVKKAAIHLSRQFKAHSLKKTYLAVVPRNKKLPPKQRLENKIFYDRRRNKSYIRSWMEDGGKPATLSYELIDSIQRYALLKVHLETGRHHQIRVQLADFGYPLKGDVKYGFKRRNRDRSIQLHAWKIVFIHPSSGEEILIQCTPPNVDVWRYFEI